LSDLYADNRENEILNSDSDVPTTSSCKQLRPSDVVFVSDSETSTEEEESSELEISNDKTSDVWRKLIKNQAVSLSLEPQV